MAAIIVAGGVTATVVAAAHEAKVVSSAAQRSFQTTALTVADGTRLQLSRYEDLVTGLQALHRSKPLQRNQDSAHRLPEITPNRFAGLLGVVVKLRSAASPDQEQMSDVHVEPHLLGAEDLGLVPANHAQLAATLAEATDTGQPVISAPLRIGSADDAPVGVVMYAPLYRDGARVDTPEQRRDAVTGWVGAIFRVDLFFNEVLADVPGVALEVFDGTPGNGEPMDATTQPPAPGAAQEPLSAVLAPGRLWTLRLQPMPGDAGDGGATQAILVVGLALTLVLGFIVGWLGFKKDRALKLVGERSGDLRRSEQRFRSLASSSPLGVFSVSATGDCEYANERLCELTGRTFEELEGAGLSRAYHPDDRGALRKAVTRQGDRTSALRLRIVLPDGSLRWVKTHAAPLRDDQNELAGWVGSVEDVTAEVQVQIATQQLSVELAHQARHDYLTGLGNRPHFTAQMTELLADPDAPHLAVLFFDIDRFKVVNDSLGHDAGDRLLAAVAERLRTSVRPGDISARFGGDEFVVGLIGISDPDVAAAQAERLVGALNHTIVLDGHEVNVSVSMGVVLSEPGCSPELLLTRADSAMYRAKARGKGRYELYRPSAPSAPAASTLELEQQLRNAIEHEQLRVHFQPIVSVKSQDVMGVEALVRWQHPERGLLLPGEFIPLAEETGLVLTLGAWVLRRACAQLQEWQSVLAADRPFYVTVNVSARQLADSLFPSVVATALSDFAVDPGSVCLEITESALVQDLEVAQQALRSLRDLGVRIAVDDFGTGYSSLTHLKLLPIDMLKIDRSFVSDLGIHADNTAIVGAVVKLASALGLTSVAEGVEEADQLNWLSSLGCDLAQGYYFARPQTADEITLLISAEDAAASAANMAAALRTGG